MTLITKDKENTDLSYIVVEGVIGVGKTTLAKLLSDDMNSDLTLEQFEQNPFLEKFYKEPSRYAFQTQVFFLLNRYQQQQSIAQKNLFANFLVSDYLFEKDKIFAQINLSGEEYKLYENLYSQIEKNIVKPDLVVYLQSNIDKLILNISKRNRNIEKNIQTSYLEKLIESYNHFFFSYKSSPLLIVNTDELDFVNNKSDFEHLKQMIFRKDRGLFEYFSPASKKLF